jgi:hypothetical protein
MAYLVALFLVVGTIFVLFVGSIAVGTMIPSAVLVVIAFAALLVRDYYQRKKEWPNAKVRTRTKKREDTSIND